MARNMGGPEWPVRGPANRPRAVNGAVLFTYFPESPAAARRHAYALPMSDRAELLHGFYADEYARVAVSARDSAAGRYMHGAIERRFGSDARFARVLELGGNRGEHVPFVRHAYDEYHLTDLR